MVPSQHFGPPVLIVRAVGILVAGAAFAALAVAVYEPPEPAPEVETMEFPNAGGAMSLRASAATASADSFDLTGLAIPEDRMTRGGVQRGAAADIDEPNFMVEKASQLKADDRVIGIARDGVARAYPLRLLAQHIVVNDRIGALAFAVVYCPNSEAASVLDRTLENSPISLGVTGLLFDDNVLLFSAGRRESVFSHMMAQGVSGPHVGRQLRLLPMELTAWSDWRNRYPETLVWVAPLSAAAERPEPVTADPPSESVDSAEAIDGRLLPRQQVLGVRGPDGRTKAYPVAAFADEHAIDDELGDARIRLRFNPTANSLRVEAAPAGVEWMYCCWSAWRKFHAETEVFEPAIEAAAR